MGKRDYLVQPKLFAERNADYEAGKSINEKWKPISSENAFKKNPDGFCGNVGTSLAIDKKTKKVLFLGDFVRLGETQISLYEAISCALAMYRTICMIENPIVESQGAAGYKVPWNISLEHVETGEILMISEWKGAFGISTRFHTQEDLPKSYRDDMEEFLNLLLSDKSPHPYDGCTAGMVA